MFYLHFLPFLP